MCESLGGALALAPRAATRLRPRLRRGALVVVSAAAGGRVGPRRRLGPGVPRRRGVQGRYSSAEPPEAPGPLRAGRPALASRGAGAARIATANGQGGGGGGGGERRSGGGGAGDVEAAVVQSFLLKQAQEVEGPEADGPLVGPPPPPHGGQIRDDLTVGLGRARRPRVGPASTATAAGPGLGPTKTAAAATVTAPVLPRRGLRPVGPERPALVVGGLPREPLAPRLPPWRKPPLLRLDISTATRSAPRSRLGLATPRRAGMGRAGSQGHRGRCLLGDPIPPSPLMS